ncbi:hypothetical protein [Methylopila sp. Yamaguchi]|uniref:hypothetical protein n=1 Tax=Methylopila sp. Yamaguchi TaxID=1437817 RepID=UPI000CC4E75D|nr:hypothetical protein [Methylopila sp. Yamaguchi]GBD49360.1 hypothetical protein METY_2573 [Methylopila sp. Yamaguchi]
MVKSLGINLMKGVVHHAVLEGTADAPVYVAHDRSRFDADQGRTDQANFFRNLFNELITRHAPTVIGYRVSLDAKKADQVAYLHFPYGVLNLLAYDQHLPSEGVTSSAFTAKRLKRIPAPGTKFDKLASCDTISGCPSGWNNDAKIAALTAWIFLT